MILRFPRGYRALVGVRPLAVSHEQFAPVITELLAQGSLYDWAAAHPERREFRGRGPVYSAPLPNGGPRVVVRHARRGGLLAPLLRDLYLPPTPATSELLIAALLQRAGVPTPPVIAFATYRAAVMFRRVDVMTAEIEGADLAVVLSRGPDADTLAAIRRAVARLLVALINAGAWHQDLNARNILLASTPGGDLRAFVLDVDRVRFVPAGDPHMGAANLERLKRSMTKFRTRGEAALGDVDFDEIERLVHEEEAARAATRATALEEHMPWE